MMVVAHNCAPPSAHERCLATLDWPLNREGSRARLLRILPHAGPWLTWSQHAARPPMYRHRNATGTRSPTCRRESTQKGAPACGAEPSTSGASVGRRAEFAARGLHALGEFVGVRKHCRTADAAIKGRSIRRLVFALDQNAIETAMATNRAFEARVVDTFFLTDRHGASLANDRSIRQGVLRPARPKLAPAKPFRRRSRKRPAFLQDTFDAFDLRHNRSRCLQ